MATYSIISSDSHVFEPPDLWTSRVAPVFREWAPHWVQAGGNDQLIVDGQKVGTVGLISQAGRRFEAPEAITFEGQLAQVRPGGWDPDEHVKDMDLDGIDGGVLYPSNGLFLFAGLWVHRAAATGVLPLQRWPFTQRCPAAG
jgi:hypothetical protein